MKEAERVARACQEMSQVVVRFISLALTNQPATEEDLHRMRKSKQRMARIAKRYLK